MRLPRILVGIVVAGAAVGAAAAQGAVSGPVPASGPATPFAPGCNGAPQSGTIYFNTEPEAMVDANPVNPNNLVGTHQQDRISTGGANGLGTSVSTDGGQTWQRLVVGQLPRFSRCSGGTAANGGDYERATDPWVSFGPDGDAYQISVSFNDTRDLANAVIVSESKDGGFTWGPNRVLIRDQAPTAFNDKESITADYTNANYVYAVWDRLIYPNERSKGQSFEHAAAFRGPIMFSRSTDGGTNWQTRQIYDPGQNDQTIGNQIVVLPNGELVNGFNLLRYDKKSVDGQKITGGAVAVMWSTDKGATWSGPRIVSALQAADVRDPRDGALVRTGDIIPEFASDERSGTKNVYAVWQDVRFSTNGQLNAIAFSKSTDGGRTWSMPRGINTVRTTQAFTPMVRVDDQGNIGVTYYDFRFDTTASPTLDTDHWFLRSTDGGNTWSEQRVTPTSFDMRTAPYARGYFVGDYAGLTAEGTRFTTFFTAAIPPYTDARASAGSPSDAQNRTEVLAANITP
jgi:hypothetical protein